MEKYKTDEYCLCCGIVAPGGNALHHVKTRGAGGCDSKFNLMPLCFVHHTEVHKIGMNRFSERYIKVYQWLKDNDWIFFELNQKWIRFPKGSE